MSLEFFCCELFELSRWLELFEGSGGLPKAPSGCEMGLSIGLAIAEPILYY